MGQSLNPVNLKARMRSIEVIMDRHVTSWLKNKELDMDDPVGAVCQARIAPIMTVQH
jgi:hypothetical protein